MSDRTEQIDATSAAYAEHVRETPPKPAMGSRNDLANPPKTDEEIVLAAHQADNLEREIDFSRRFSALTPEHRDDRANFSLKEYVTKNGGMKALLAHMAAMQADVIRIHNPPTIRFGEYSPGAVHSDPMAPPFKRYACGCTAALPMGAKRDDGTLATVDDLPADCPSHSIKPATDDDPIIVTAYKVAPEAK